VTEFTKLKMAFSVALLAALFTLRSLFDRVSGYTFTFLGFDIELLLLYYLFAGALGLSAYCFALELLAGRSASPLAQKAGNTFYALAVLMPPAFIAVFLIAHASGRLAGWMGDPAYGIAFSVAMLLLVAALGVYVLRSLGRAIGERDRSFTVNQLGDEEAASLTKATGLLEAGLYDLAVVQSFQTIETSLRRLLLARGVAPRRWTMKEIIATAQRHDLISDADRQVLHDIRVLRNGVIHEAREVDRTETEDVIDATRRVVTRFHMRTANGDTEQEQEAAPGPKTGLDAGTGAGAGSPV